MVVLACRCKFDHFHQPVVVNKAKLLNWVMFFPTLLQWRGVLISSSCLGGTRARNDQAKDINTSWWLRVWPKEISTWAFKTTYPTSTQTSGGLRKVIWLLEKVRHPKLESYWLMEHPWPRWTSYCASRKRRGCSLLVHQDRKKKAAIRGTFLPFQNYCFVNGIHSNFKTNTQFLNKNVGNINE